MWVSDMSEETASHSTDFASTTAAMEIFTSISRQTGICLEGSIAEVSRVFAREITRPLYVPELPRRQATPRPAM